jgi:NitT/TauT family transport system permease protein
VNARAIRLAVANTVYGAFGILLLFAVWEAILHGLHPDAFLFPSPSAVGDSLRSEGHALVAAAWVTGYEIVLGFAAAAVGGFALAVALHKVPRAASVLWPGVLILQVTPQIALAPLFIAWFGIGLTSKIAFAFLIAFFPIVVNTYFGLASLPEEVEELAASMGTSRRSYFLRFELPATLPYFFTGAKIAMTYAVIGAIVAEFIASNRGLGNLLLEANGSLDAALGVVSLIALSLMGVVLYTIVGGVARLAVPWHAASRRKTVDS